MNNPSPKWSQTFTPADLQPIVAQIFDQPAVEILNWQIQKLGGGAAEHTGRGMGVYRLTGTADYNGLKSPWSVILKVMGPSEDPNNNIPTTPEYWKREVLIYQSGILKQLPGSIVAPRCYTVQELPDGECRLWLEDIHEDQPSWTMEQHQLTARHLGQFNGAYLTGHPLPPQSWLLNGRMHQWLETMVPDESHLLSFAETDLGRRWMPKQNVERLMRLWEKRQPLLAAFDRLPTCFCHHDAFRRNMMLRKRENGTLETVAIDWSYTGYGKIGQEIGMTTAVALNFLEVDAANAKALDNAIFTGYCTGLRDAGWQGDLQLARFGYVVTAALTEGVAFSTLIVQLIQQPGNHSMIEAIVGHPMEDIIKQQIPMHTFLMDMGDEALALMPSI